MVNVDKHNHFVYNIIEVLNIDVTNLQNVLTSIDVQ